MGRKGEEERRRDAGIILPALQHNNNIIDILVISSSCTLFAKCDWFHIDGGRRYGVIVVACLLLLIDVLLSVYITCFIHALLFTHRLLISYSCCNICCYAVFCYVLY